MTIIDSLLSGGCPWLESPGDQHGIVVSSRIRLARTVRDEPFHRRASRRRQQELVDRLGGALLTAVPGANLIQLDELSDLQRQALVERQLISRDLASAKRPVAVLTGDAVAAMINEEDHLRLQVFASGLTLPRLLEQAVAIDRRLEGLVPWEVHPTLGYLTACHTNVGTGLRASVMVHLPALAECGELKAVLRALNLLHLAVRGVHGEGSEPSGHLFQISNARTLGEDESAYVTTMIAAVTRVVAAEQVAREALRDKDRARLDDRVFRAWGLLTTARRLSTEELADSLSWLRLGTALDVLSQTDWAIPTRSRWAVLDRCALHGQPAHLQLLHAAGRELEVAERDRLRASLVRSWLMAA